MLCKWCLAVLKWEETSCAKIHLESSRHKRAKDQAAKLVTRCISRNFSLTYPKKQKAEEGPDVATPAEPVATTKNLQQASLENISDDWVATLEHVNMCGMHFSKQIGV